MAARGQTRQNQVVTSFPWCAKAITPDNTNDLTDYGGNNRGMTVRVGVAGTVKYLPYNNPDDQPITETFVEGSIIPCVVRRVFSTGTNATGLIGYF